MSEKGRPLGFRKLVPIMEAQLRLMEISGVDKKIVDMYSELIDVLDMENDKEAPDRGAKGTSGPDLNILQTVGDMNFEEIEKLVVSPSVSRKLLEEIAVIKFSIPRGSIKNIGDKDALREKIGASIRNARLHRTIGEVAKLSYGNNLAQDLESKEEDKSR